MQLDRAAGRASNKTLKDKLALAATSLLSANAQAADEVADIADDPWEYSGTLFIYKEPDRVTAVEGIFTADKAYGDSASVNYKVVLDSLTGASANGAIEQDSIQTFTRPSGNGQYVISPAETPLDDTFKDTRAQFAVNWNDRLGENTAYGLGANLSREYDYRSIGLSGQLAWDFNQRNTTFSAGIALANDTVKPVGGRPVPFSSMVIDEGQFADEAAYRQAFDLTREGGDATIESAEFLLGLTQVINRRMLLQLNYGYMDASGYLTDPYKVLSVVDNNAETQELVYERRPDAKVQHALYAMGKYHLDNSVLNLSYRYTDNDWDLDSHNLDFRWYFYLDDGDFFEPHIRWYQQSATDFYRPYLVAGESLPEFASADYRVGEMTTGTIGFKYSWLLENSARLEMRAEYYRQDPEEGQLASVPAADRFDIYPEVEALLLQFSYFWK